MENWHQFGDILMVDLEKSNRSYQTIIFVKETGRDVIGIPLVPQVLQTTLPTQLVIAKSEENGLPTDGLALCHQGVQLNGEHIKGKIGQLTFEETGKINEILAELSR